MNDSDSNQNILSGLISEVNSTHTTLQRSAARLVRSQAELSCVRDLTQLYFRGVRPATLTAGLDPTSLDPHFTEVLELSGKHSVRASYLQQLKQIQRKAAALEVQYEFSFSNGTSAIRNKEQITFSAVETKICKTLQSINPFFGDAYTQIIIDLGQEERASFRGTVHEMRELLRGLLNHFAPDAEVIAQKGFRFETGQTKPTRTQRMAFILKARQTNSAHIDPATKATSYLDVQLDILAFIPNAVYGAGSESAHADPRDLRNEVYRLKQYLDATLCDILAIS